jgi:antitoxin (DNA-binding transcriptional repressor) of toxin-antitoxin stability system
MPTVTLEEAQAKLPELIAQLQPGEEVIITRDQKPVARLTGTGEPLKPQRKLGTMKGSVLYMAPDFDAPLDDFKEYME